MIAKVWLKFLNFTAFARETARGFRRCDADGLSWNFRKTISLKGAKRRMRGKIRRVEFLTAEF